MRKLSFIIALCFASQLFGSSPKSQFTKQNKNQTAHRDIIQMFTGSYSTPDTEGIIAYRFNQKTGDFSKISGLKGISNPSFLTLDPRKNGMIYAVGEDSGTSSTINTIKYDSKTGTMQLLNSAPTHGASPCHITLSGNQSQVITANYSGGNMTLYSLNSDGIPSGEPTVIDFNQFASKQDQTSHPHFATFTPDGKHIWISNLGHDRIYTFPADRHQMIPDQSQIRIIQLPEGAGPRHIDFHPSLPLGYVIDEIDGQVNVIDYSTSTPTIRQRIVADSIGAHGSGDIHLSPNGRFLYASNRLKGDGIAIFKITPRTGLLTKVGYQPTGPHPRNFAITPNGRFLLAACRDSNEIEIYRINQKNGLLTSTGKKISQNRPVCILFQQ